MARERIGRKTWARSGLSMRRGKLRALRVHTGITDGQKTQVDDGADLKEGTQVIVGATQPSNPRSTVFSRRRRSHNSRAAAGRRGAAGFEGQGSAG